MAYASSITPMAPPRPSAPPMSNGRSRVLLPPKVMTDHEIKALVKQGFPKGLAEAMTKNNAAFALRIWVVDNSGSMTMTDGHRMVETKKNYFKIDNCTRWKEIQETVDYHSQMAALLQAPTEFRLLNDPGTVNGPQQFSIAERGVEHLNEDLMIALTTMRSSPNGVTPLAEHVREIQKDIAFMQPSLHRDGTKVVVVLATDGMPTDIRGICDTRTKTEFVDALLSLKDLPVWIVIRLCTDDEEVVEFYNQFDSQLELPLEVLDDFEGEAKEVYEHNKFLNYALPLHRCREMGYHDRVLDLLDERPLTKDELRDLFVLLFGEADGVPDPQADWVGFVKALSKIVDKDKKGQWNPMTKKVQPWVDMKKLNKAYGGGSCSVM